MLGPGPEADPEGRSRSTTSPASSSPPARRTCTRRPSAAPPPRRGLNPFLCEMANIREHCSWVHEDKADATAKAIEIVAADASRRSSTTDPLEPIKVPVTKRALVIGGGIAGIQAALDIADARPRGRRSSRRSRPSAATWASSARPSPRSTARSASSRRAWWRPTSTPTSSCSPTARSRRSSGYIGNFEVTDPQEGALRRRGPLQRLRRLLRRLPGDEIPNEFEPTSAGGRPSTCPSRRRFPPSTRSTPLRELQPRVQERRVPRARLRELLRGLRAEGDRLRHAEEIVEREVGRHRRRHRLPATMRQPSKATASTATAGIPTSSTACSSSGWRPPPGRRAGEIRRPSDGKEPKDVVFVHCVGSRDPREGHPLLLADLLHVQRQARDALQAQGARRPGVRLLHGHPRRRQGLRRVRQPRDRGGARALHPRPRQPDLPGRRQAQGLRLRHADRPAGRDRRRHGRAGHGASSPTAKASWRRRSAFRRDAYGFINEAHPKLRPVETITAGVFVAGSAQSPKDIPDTVSQASAAASKVLQLLSRPTLEREPTVAERERGDLHRLLRLRAGLPLRGHRAQGDPQPAGRPRPPRRPRQPGGLPGLRHLPGRLPVRSVDVLGFNDEQIFAQLAALAPLRWRCPRDRADRNPGGGRGRAGGVGAAHRRLRLQLVHLRRRRPGRHQPHAHTRRTCASSASPAPAGSTRCSSSRPSSTAPTASSSAAATRRLPLRPGQLARAPAPHRLRRPHGVPRARPAAASLRLGLRLRGRQVDADRQRGDRGRPRGWAARAVGAARRRHPAEVRPARPGPASPVARPLPRRASA